MQPASPKLPELQQTKQLPGTSGTGDCPQLAETVRNWTSGSPASGQTILRPGQIWLTALTGFD
jgi:hypothetical protein